MIIRSPKRRTRENGWALLVVLSLAATALLVMASVMSWSNENSAVVARNNETFATTYAAEAATEKVLAQLVQDDQDYGEGWVFGRTSSYTSMIPSSSDDPYWTNYQFSGGTTNNSIIVSRVITNSTTLLNTPYAGLICIGATYEIIANAQNIHSEYGIVATVGQQILLGQIPIFQFAIFYNDFMEIDPGASMTITGLVHGNTNVNLAPNTGVTLTFNSTLSTTGTLYKGANSYNSSSSGSGTVTYVVPSTSGVMPLNLPIGTNVSGTNTGQSVNAIIQVPPASESPSSAVGTNRLYNQADLIVLISNGNTFTVTSGVGIDNQGTTIPTNQWQLFLSTNGTFYNGREGAAIHPVNLNVGALRQWSSTNTVLRPVLAAAPSRSSLSADVQSIFIADMRTFTNSTIEPGIVLTNGAALPSNGFSVVSPDPVYVAGNWNVTTNVNASGTPINTTTQSYQVSNTLPSAIYTDAITILSPSWSPLNSSNSISSRVATGDTVNAAILTGNVASTNTSYSGGVENFLRLLEDWGSVNLYYNGSMVQMFTSKIGKAAWPGTGTVYNPPTRDWAFDTNFLNPSQLPPLTPRIIYLNRNQWNTLPPRTTQF